MANCNHDCFNCRYEDCIDGNATKRLPTGKRLGDRIKTARLMRGLTQKEASKLIGAKNNTICTWERNRSIPSKMYMDKILLAFPELKNGRRLV